MIPAAPAIDSEFEGAVKELERLEQRRAKLERMKPQRSKLEESEAEVTRHPGRF
jgi:hypothetical protein